MAKKYINKNRVEMIDKKFIENASTIGQVVLYDYR